MKTTTIAAQDVKPGQKIWVSPLKGHPKAAALVHRGSPSRFLSYDWKLAVIWYGAAGAGIFHEYLCSRDEPITVEEPTPPRIAFTGASGTGKTSVALLVAEQLGVPFCPIGSRSVARDMGFDSPYDVDRAGKRAEFQDRLFWAKRRWETEHEDTGFVTDRTHLDNYVYRALHDATHVSTCARREAMDATDNYSMLVFCATTRYWDLGSDPARVANPAYHELYQMVLHSLVADYRGGLYLGLQDPGIGTAAAEVIRVLNANDPNHCWWPRRWGRT